MEITRLKPLLMQNVHSGMTKIDGVALVGSIEKTTKSNARRQIITNEEIIRKQVKLCKKLWLSTDPISICSA